MLADAVRVFERAAISYLVIGSIAGNVLGDSRWPSVGSDLDLFVREHDARLAIEALCDDGFYELWSNEDWLFKARKEGVLVDVIFRAAAHMELDDEMRERAMTHTLLDTKFHLVSPEDYVVMQVATHGPETAQHWFHALGVIARRRLDWGYLRRRSASVNERMSAFLLYARSEGMNVPFVEIERLLDRPA